MPTLDWIGKKAVLNHHREVPYRLLRCNSELSAGDPNSANLLVQGDNLLALNRLLKNSLSLHRYNDLAHRSF
jgi:adenine-specific DNA-methyltransferase